jgi:CubicO group peptidase (beta-lactamase class C family)
VTTYDPASEVDPREVGMTRDGVATIWEAVERLYAVGLHPAAALCVRRRGRVVIDRAVGFARGGGPGDRREEEPVLATPETLFTIFSASKAFTAMLIHLLDERGALHLDDPVAEYIPGFGRRRKRWITLRHVLTHRAGIPTIPGSYIDLDLLTQPERIIELLCEAEPVSRPGRRLAYHALTGGFVLGEVVRRVTGRDVRAFFKDEVLDPLGFQHMNYGLARADLPKLARNYFTGLPIAFPMTALTKRALGVGFAEACQISNDPRFVEAIIPAGNVIGTANEVSRFYQLLLDGGEMDGVRIFSPQTIRRAVSEQTYFEIDLTLGLPMRYGLGFMLGGRRLSLFGPNTGKAFGHLGFTNVIAYADPEREVAVCLMTSGKPLLAPAVRHVYNVLRRITLHCSRG